MDDDMYVDGALHITPANAFKLPDINSRGFLQSLHHHPEDDFLAYLAYESEDMYLQADGELGFNGRARWPDFEFELDKFLNYCVANGISVKGTIDITWDAYDYNEYRYDIDTDSTTRWLTNVGSQIIFEDDWRLKLATLVKDASRDWHEWADSDDPISGADCVDWTAALMTKARALIPEREL